MESNYLSLHHSKMSNAVSKVGLGRVVTCNEIDSNHSQVCYGLDTNHAQLMQLFNISIQIGRYYRTHNLRSCWYYNHAKYDSMFHCPYMLIF